MPNAIHAKIKALEPIIQPWAADTNPALVFKSTNLMGLKKLLTKCFEVLKTEFPTSEASALTADIEAQLDVIQQHIPNYPNQSYFNQCVISAFEIFKLLHTFGYFNYRLNKIIRTSLANLQQAASAHSETLKTVAGIKEVKSEIDEYKTQIEEFYQQCLGEEDDCFKSKLAEFDEAYTKILDNEGYLEKIEAATKASTEYRDEILEYKVELLDGDSENESIKQQIDEAYTKILDDDGYLEKIEAANKASTEYRDEILEYKVELLDGDSENESIKQQIHNFNQEMLANQAKMQKFITEYITGTVTTTKTEAGLEEVKTKSKKELVDELHKSFEEHVATEKANIAEYIEEFDKYKTAKQAEIEGLLKSATNASLASAFETFRTQTKELKVKSERYFLGSIILLVAAIILPYVPYFKEWIFTSDNVYIELLRRVLFTGPFVWLAYYQRPLQKPAEIRPP